ncbi:uncharacterized protein LOC130243899 [Danio aesculapii]|uniref:uncharacterized protein LOC130243899 n=1 Tax=Danio aesculapii TaxID=1142201 RepID=UPI0024BFCF99|nr:uncharacterized protein LOC130243899 [Danio aesculapii]
MKLISSSLTLLVFINAVFSAAMRDGGEDLIHFLKDAFEMNQTLDQAEPTQLSEISLVPEMILEAVHPTVPSAECKAPETADLSKTIPKPNSVELTDVSEERSIETSNSDSRLPERASTEDSRESDKYKRLELRTALTDTHKALQEHYGNSAESMSMESTDIDRDRTKGSNQQRNKESVIEDVSSQEKDRPEENERHHPPRTQKMIKKHHFDSAEFVDRPDSEEQGRSQEQISGIVAKQNFQATLDDSREAAGGIPGCTETSAEHPMEENNSLDDPNVEQIRKDTTSYQNQLKKICPSKRVRAFDNLRAQLDLHSPERVNSELLDRDDSGERLRDHVALPL